jgi:hypothetical protein
MTAQGLGVGIGDDEIDASGFCDLSADGVTPARRHAPL